MSLFLNKTHHTEQRQRTAQVGVNRGALPCIGLAYATSGYCMTNEPHFTLTLRAECKTACAIFKGNEVNKLWGVAVQTQLKHVGVTLVQ